MIITEEYQQLQQHHHHKTNIVHFFPAKQEPTVDTNTNSVNFILVDKIYEKSLVLGVNTPICQYDYIYDKLSNTTIVQAENILHLENLNLEFNDLMKRYDYKLDVNIDTVGTLNNGTTRIKSHTRRKQINPKTNKLYTTLDLTSETKHLVYNKCKDDFDKLGYKI